jgi:phage tail sheath gpL-like
VQAPVDGSRYTITQRNSLIAAGFADTYIVADVVRIGRLVTTYKLNALGGADTTYRDVQTLYTLMRVLRRMRNRIETKYPRHKLADDGTATPANTLTPSIVKGELVSLYQELVEEGLVENPAAFKAALVVARNTVDKTRVDVTLAPDLINQLRIFTALVQFRL